MKIVIVYELPQRELENALLLKYYIEQKGYNCDIVKFPYRDYIGLRKKYYDNVDLVAVHSLYDDNVINHLVYCIFGKVKYIVNLQVEQIDTNKLENDPSSYQHPKGNAKYGYHVCWGNRTIERFTACGIDKSHLIKCGPIQMDFLRNEFSSYYYSKKQLMEKCGIEGDKRIALFISSFSFVELSESGRKELSDKLGNDYFEEFEQLSIDSQKEIVNWFRRYLETNPNYIIIYRKHPAERLTKEIEHLFKSYPNQFLLISNYSVKQWILISDKILTWYSTSAAEVFFSEKSLLITRPIEIKYDNEISILNGITPISTYDDFREAMNESKYISCLDDKVIHSYYDVDDSCPSYKRLGDSIINTLYYGEIFPWDKFETKKYNLMNFRTMIWSIAYVPYKKIISFIHKASKRFNVKLPRCLLKKIDNQTLEKEQIKNDFEEEKRLMKQASVLRGIVCQNNMENIYR